MVLKITDTQWMNKDNLQTSGVTMGGLHLFGEFRIDYGFLSKEQDSVNVKLVLIPHTLVLDRVGTDYEKLQPEDVARIISKCDVSWIPELVFSYFRLADSENSGMNLPSFETWVKEKMKLTSEEDEYGIKEQVDKTVESYLDLLENLVKEEVWDK